MIRTRSPPSDGEAASVGKTTERGQAHTLEAVAASVMLLASVVFALQVTAVTPLTASTASQHIENQQAGVAEGVLDSAAEQGTLKETVLLWNESASAPFGVGDRGTYSLGGPPTAFGETLEETFLDRGLAFDLAYRYVDGDGDVRQREIVDLGKPSDHAVTVTRTVTLFDSDHLYYPDGTKQSTTLDGTSTFFATDVHAGPTYNVIQVELTIWRM